MKIQESELAKINRMLDAYCKSNELSTATKETTNCSACFNSCYGSCGYNCTSICRSSSK